MNGGEGMTRKEAARELMYLKSKTRQEGTLEAIEMARALLMAEPHEDCINREAVIDELKWIEEYGMLEMNRALKMITDLPSVTPARKNGKWIVHDIYYQIRCMRCGRISPMHYKWDFCPHCGADMREGDEG